MELLLIVVSGLVLGSVLWGIGFIRAVRHQLVNDRLKVYYQRSE